METRYTINSIWQIVSAFEKVQKLTHLGGRRRVKGCSGQLPLSHARYPLCRPRGSSQQVTKLHSRANWRRFWTHRHRRIISSRQPITCASLSSSWRSLIPRYEDNSRGFDILENTGLTHTSSPGLSSPDPAGTWVCRPDWLAPIAGSCPKVPESLAGVSLKISHSSNFPMTHTEGGRSCPHASKRINCSDSPRRCELPKTTNRPPRAVFSPGGVSLFAPHPSVGTPRPQHSPQQPRGLPQNAT